jgi:uncharacterized protein (TIGR00251 family)
VSDATDLVTIDGDTAVLAVHVQPGAGRSALVGRHGDALKLRVAAPPVGDRANTAAAEMVAEIFDVPTANVTLVSGQKSRLKRFRATGVDPELALDQVERALADAVAPAGPKRRRGE